MRPRSLIKDALFLFVLGLSVYGLCAGTRGLPVRPPGVPSGAAQAPAFRHPVQALFTLPGTLAARFFGSRSPAASPSAELMGGVLTSGVALSLTASLLFLLCAQVWQLRRDTAALVGIATAFAQTATSFAGGTHRDVIGTAFLVAAFFCGEVKKHSPDYTRPQRLGAAVGLFTGLSLSCSILAFPFAVVLLGMHGAGSRERLPLFGGFVAGILPLVVSFCLAPAGSSAQFLFDPHGLASFPPPPTGFLLHLNNVAGWGDLSLFKYSPICVAGLLGLVLIRTPEAAPRGYILAGFILHLAFVSTMGGISPCQYGPRLLIPALPFLLVGLSSFESVTSHWKNDLRFCLWTLCAVSIVINLTGLIGGPLYCSTGEWGPWKYLRQLDLLKGNNLALFTTALPLFFIALALLFRSVTPELERYDATPLDQDWEAHLRLFGRIAVLTAAVYYFSGSRNSPYDYTYRIATAILHGRLGLIGVVGPSWLPELVPLEGRLYSVFPLGSVISMLPVAILKEIGAVDAFPSRAIVAFIAAVQTMLASCLFFRLDLSRRAILTLVLFLNFGTWHWANFGFGGAWQIAIALAVLGQLGALYYSLALPKPVICGLWFALAFGNRTEVVLVAPIFLYCLTQRLGIRDRKKVLESGFRFALAPMVLGISTLAYNNARFGSMFDFGYAWIPGVLNEPWYRNGIFSWTAIGPNAYQMLLASWRSSPTFPYLVPSGWGGSIFIASPYLLFLLRRPLRLLAFGPAFWGAIALLTVILWIHGNPGGWQYSYRYAGILLPWLLCILAQGIPRGYSWLDTAMLSLSIAISTWATVVFNWTGWMRP